MTAIERDLTRSTAPPRTMRGLSLAARFFSLVSAAMLLVLIWFLFPAVRDLWLGKAQIAQVSDRLRMAIGAAIGMFSALIILSYVDYLTRREVLAIRAARRARANAAALEPEPRRPPPKLTNPPAAILDLTPASAVHPFTPQPPSSKPPAPAAPATPDQTNRSPVIPPM